MRNSLSGDYVTELRTALEIWLKLKMLAATGYSVVSVRNPESGAILDDVLSLDKDTDWHG
jgi:hypothetical protein